MIIKKDIESDIKNISESLEVDDVMIIDEIKVKDKSKYKYAREHISKENLAEIIALETGIVKAEYQGNDLYLYIDYVEGLKDPIIKNNEMYFNCLLVIHNANLLHPSSTKLKNDITQGKLYDTRISYTDGCIQIFGDRGIDSLKFNDSSWEKFSFDFEDLSYYFDEIYDYFGGETLG